LPESNTEAGKKFPASFFAPPTADASEWKRWSFPPRFIGPKALKLFGETFAPMFQGAAVLLALWLILLWMYRRRLFLRV